jgi:glucokinase
LVFPGRIARLVEWRCNSPIETRGFALSPLPVIAVDLGGTRIRAAIVLPDGTRLAKNDNPTPSDRGARAVVSACLAAAHRARAEAPADISSALAGIGISSPGPVDPARGVVIEPPNLGPDFRDIPLAAELAEAEGLPAFLDRDTNVAALGEHRFGAARDCDDFIYLTVSTGVGGAIVSGGSLFHGPDGLAGELGHVPVSLDGPRCGCGGVGHVEAYAAGVSLARQADALVAADLSPFLADRARELRPGEALSAKDVAEGALAGDPACSELMATARRAVAVACVGFVNTFNPHRIVIGGSIAEAEGERLLEPIRTAIASEAFESLARRVRVVPAGLGGDVSLAGAQPLVMSRLSNPANPLTPTITRPGKPIAISGGTPA